MKLGIVRKVYNPYNNDSTLRDHLAKDGHRVQRGAVPPPVTELVLALIDGELSAAPYGVHHLYIALADLHLSLDESTQFLAGLLIRDAPHRRQLSQISLEKGAAVSQTQNSKSTRRV